MRAQRGEANGCLIIVLIIVGLLLFGCIKMVASVGGTDDCYTTGEPGSAQADRDLSHCIQQDR